MTLALLACGAALLLWPVPRPGAQRLRWLAETPRLARPRASSATAPPCAPIRPGVTVLIAAMSAGIAAAAWRGLSVGVAGGVAAGVVAASFVRIARRKAMRARESDLSAALRLLRAELEVGNAGESAFLAAAAAAGQYRTAFEVAAHAVREGDDMAEAMSRAGGAAELITLGHTWQVAHALGMPIGEALTHLDDDLRDRRVQRRTVASTLAGPSSSAALLAGLPLLGIVLGAAMGAHPLDVLLGPPAGRIMLCAGILLDAAGVLWTARLITAAERL